MSLRVLFIGFGTLPSCNAGEEFETVSCKAKRGIGSWDFLVEKNPSDLQSSFDGAIPTIYDYHLVFLGEPNLKLDGWGSYLLYRILEDKQNEIMRFIKKGGIFVSFLKRYDLQGSVSNYGWQNIIKQTHIVNKHGNKITVKESEFQNILINFEFTWDCHLNPNSDISGMRSLASNNIADPVAIEVEHGQGRLILLPQPKNAEDITRLLRQLTDVIRIKYITGNISEDVEPPWVNQVNLADEDKLISLIRTIDEELANYKRIKRILYQTGNILVDELTGIFQTLGLNAKNLDHRGEQDIEIEEENTKFIVEVKGKDSYANVDDLRQLLDWYVSEESKNESKSFKKQIRGVFIINHYRKMPPHDRKEALSDGALRLAKQNKFIVLTTLDIFDLLKKHIKSPMTKDDILEFFDSKIAK